MSIQYIRKIREVRREIEDAAAHHGVKSRRAPSGVVLEGDVLSVHRAISRAQHHLSLTLNGAVVSALPYSIRLSLK